MRLSWSEGSSVHSATHPWLLMAWTIFWFPFLYGLLPLGAGLCLIVGFSSFSLLFCSFRSLATIPAVPLCHSCCVMLFDPCLLGLFHWIYTYVTLGFLVPLHCLWAPLSHFLLLGHPRPICFPWASSAHFLILHSHELLLTFLDFPDPITISFIFEAHGFSINSLFSHFITSALLWPIFTFLHRIIPMRILFLSLGSFTHLLLSRPIYLFYGPIIHCSYHSGLMVLLTIS